MFACELKGDYTSKKQIKKFLFECDFIENSFKFLMKPELFETWNNVKKLIQANKVYEKFLELFTKRVDNFFSAKEKKLNEY